MCAEDLDCTPMSEGWDCVADTAAEAAEECFVCICAAFCQGCSAPADVCMLLWPRRGSDSMAQDSGTLAGGGAWEEGGLGAKEEEEAVLLAMAGVGETESRDFLTRDDLSALKFLDRK